MKKSFLLMGLGCGAVLIIVLVFVKGNQSDRRVSISSSVHSSQASGKNSGQVLSAAVKISALGVSVPSSPILQERFDRAPDLYRYVTDAASSRDPTVWAHGFMAASNCMVVKTDQDKLRSRLAASPADGLAVRSAQAARLLLERCHGFVINDDVANISLRKRIVDNVRGSDEYIVGISHGSISAAQFRAVLARGDQLTFEKVMVDVLPSALHTRGLDEKSSGAMGFALGYMLAQCDLGRDCSSSSLTYALLCASEGRCVNSAEELYTEGLSPEMLHVGQQYRAEIVRAFRQRNANYFGMNR